MKSIDLIVTELKKKGINVKKINREKSNIEYRQPKEKISKLAN